MQNRYRVIFTGKVDAEIPPSEIRRRLLKLYGDKHDLVERFFAGRPLVVKKDIDYRTAEKYRLIFEKAGVSCKVVEDRKVSSGLDEQKTSPAQPLAPPKETVPSRREDRQTPQPARQAAHGARIGETGGANGSRETVPSRTPALTTSGSDKRSLLKASKLQTVLAAVMIGLIFLSAGIRIWALNGARGIFPPDHVSVNENEVCVHLNGTLFFLTPDGRIVKRVHLPSLGIMREPADLQLLKNGDFIVGDLDKGEILRCDGAAHFCRRIGPAGDHAINENFKFLADEERNLLFLADTNNHALFVQGLDGSGMQRIESASRIGFPNDMALDKDGRLWLSNTAAGEVLSFELKDDRFAETGNTVRLSPRTAELENMEEILKQKPGGEAAGLKELLEKIRELRMARRKLGDDRIHRRPLAIAWDAGGNLWVAAGDGFITTAGVRVFGPEGNQIDRLSLEKGAIPVDIATMGDRILIADRSLFQLFSVSSSTHTLGVFGDEGFQRELSRARHELWRYEAIAAWAVRGIWLLVLGTIVLVTFIVAKNYRRHRAVVPGGSPASSRVTAKAGPLAAAAGMPSSEIAKEYRLQFTGSGAEYFRIWIVNVFLTILTLGIYAPWAKVRTRRYFYRNTLLDGHAFDYTADPVALLKGYGIVGVGLLLYYLTKSLNPLYSLIVFGLFALLIPLLFYKSLRFFTRNSVYRNVRFRFLGSLGESYRTYLLYPLLVPFTVGLIVPYWEFRRRKYFFNNLGYGATTNVFAGTHGPFYGFYIKLWLIGTLFILSGGILVAVIGPNLAGASVSGKGHWSSGFLLSMFLMYGMLLLIASFFQMYLYAWTTNYCLGRSRLGKLRFESTLSGGRLFWIRVSNVVAIVLSMGMLTPWAKVRRMRYVAENLSVLTTDDLNDFASAVGPDERSYGDAATDFFDFEVGL